MHQNPEILTNCWSCEAANSLDDCLQNGAPEQCWIGDTGGCMIESWKEKGVLKKLTIGCKQPYACVVQKTFNFWDYLQNPALSAAREGNALYNKFTTCKPELENNTIQPRSKCV